MIMGVRREGDTMGALSYKLISPRARNILMLFIYFYLLLIMGAFGNLVGKSLMTKPSGAVWHDCRDPGGHPGRAR